MCRKRTTSNELVVSRMCRMCRMLGSMDTTAFLLEHFEFCVYWINVARLLFFVIAQAAFNNLDSCDCFVEAIADQLPYKFADMVLIKSKQSTATGKAIQGYDGSVEYTDGIPCMKCSRTFKSWTSLFKHWNRIEK